MGIWKQVVSPSTLNNLHRDTAAKHLGIEFLEVGEDFITARMPVDARTRQPYGLLHGGVSVVLAETLGSCGAAFAVPLGWRAVGMEVNANHVKGVTHGWVTGTARPLHLGRTTQIWQTEIRNDAAELVCVSRITMALLPPSK